MTLRSTIILFVPRKRIVYQSAAAHYKYKTFAIKFYIILMSRFEIQMVADIPFVDYCAFVMKCSNLL
jgi:hypothetical protein